MAPKKYKLPTALPTGTRELVPDDLPTDALTPTSIVLCLNRTQETLIGQHDARHYTIPPGYFTMPYGAAKHLQQRLIVPGTRDPQAYERIVSKIAIEPDIKPEDRARDFVPFTKAQLAAFDGQVEGLAREEMQSPDARHVKPVSMRSVRANSALQRSGGSGDGRVKRPQRSRVDDQGTSEARERAGDALKPSSEPSSAERDQVEAGRGRK